MKTKRKNESHAKAIDLMKRETNRAVAHVEFLEKLYKEMMESRKNVSQKS